MRALRAAALAAQPVAARRLSHVGNQVRESVEHDAHDESAGTGTDGTANFWIDNHCENDVTVPLGLCDD